MMVSGDVRQFITLVSELREAQRGYFRTRSPYLLADAKKLSAKVDKKLLQMEKYLIKTNSKKMEDLL